MMDDFAAIYRRHREQLFRYLYYLTGNPDEAQELLQETFFQAYQSLGSYRGNAKVSTWLYGIARNVCHKEWDKEKRRRAISLAEDHSLSQTPEDIVAQSETHRALLNALVALPSPQKEVVILRSFNDLSFKEIGAILGQKENWARVNYYRAKLELRKSLQREEM